MRRNRMRLTNKTKRYMGVKTYVFNENAEKIAQWVFNQSGAWDVLKDTVEHAYALRYGLTELRPTIIKLQKDMAAFNSLRNKAIAQEIGSAIEDITSPLLEIVAQSIDLDESIVKVRDEFWKLASS